MVSLKATSYMLLAISCKYMSQDYFSERNIDSIDYKDINHLKKFTNPHGRIFSRKRTGLSAKHQRKVEEAIKRARFMGLLPFIAR
jgi:small subunit ribosomal protein S18